MDPAGGPGPPRPPADSTTNIAPPPPEGYVRALSSPEPLRDPASSSHPQLLTFSPSNSVRFLLPTPSLPHESSELQMFPFAPAQQQPPLPLQIPHAPDSLTLPNVTASFDAPAPFTNNPFIPPLPRRAPTDPAHPNPSENVNSNPPTLHQINPSAVTSQPVPISSAQPPDSSPPHADQQQVSNDIFGELEKALALGASSAQNNPDESFDVLDDALAMPPQPTPSRSQPVSAPPQVMASQQQPSVSLPPWPEPHPSDAASQRQPQLQQTQFQTQLQQQSQRRELEQRQLQQQAMAQQHLRQQQQQQHHHQLQHQRMQEEQLRRQQLQQQQMSHISQAQSNQQSKSTAQAIAPQPHLLSKQSQPTLQQHLAKSQSELTRQRQQQSQSLQHSQQLPQTQPIAQQRQQPTAAFIQPRGMQQVQSTASHPPGMGQLGMKVGYPAQGFPMVGGVTGQMLNGGALGVAGSPGAMVPGSLGGVPLQGGETSESQMKLKSVKKQSLRRPRSKVQQRNLQARAIQSAETNSQTLPQNMQIPQHFTHGMPQQMLQQQQQLRGQSPQQAFVSPQQAGRQSPGQQVQTSPAHLVPSQQQELQNRILQQQMQMHQQKGPHGQPAMPAPSGHTLAQHGVFPQHGANVAGAGAVQGAQKIAMGTAQQIAAQRAAQNAKLSGNVQPNNVVGKFDAAAIQNLLARTRDPKVQAVLRQQLDMMRGSGFGQAGPNSGSLVHPQAGMQSQGQAIFPAQSTNTQPSRAGMQQFSGLVRTTSAPQVGAFHQQQLAQKQQAFRNQPQQQYFSHGQRQSPDLQRNTGQVFSRTAPYSHQLSQDMLNVLNPHASQSMASLPQHVQHQIRAQIQAQHIQAQLQNQAQLANQRNANVGNDVARQQAQNVSNVLPQGSLQPDTRKLRRSPRSSNQNAEPIQPNGAVPIATSGRLDVHHQPSLSTTSQLSGAGAGAGTGTGTGAGAGAASYGQPKQTHAVQQSQAESAVRRKTPTKIQGKETSQGSQSTTSRTSSARRAAENKIAAERKRLAQEAERREIAEQKRRRLHMTPTNDYLNVLSPDYRTPFSGRVNAWQRLVAFHVLSGSKEDQVTEKEWGADVDKLAQQFQKWLGTIRRNALILKERETQSVHSDIVGLNTTALNNEECLVMEQVVLEDMYETARREAILAQRKAAIAAQQNLRVNSTNSSELAGSDADAARGSQSEQNPFIGPGRQHTSGGGTMNQAILSSSGLVTARDQGSSSHGRPSVLGAPSGAGISSTGAVGVHLNKQVQVTPRLAQSVSGTGQGYPTQGIAHHHRSPAVPIGSSEIRVGAGTSSYQSVKSSATTNSNVEKHGSGDGSTRQDSSGGQAEQRHVPRHSGLVQGQSSFRGQPGQLMTSSGFVRQLGSEMAMRSPQLLMPQEVARPSQVMGNNSMGILSGNPSNFVRNSSDQMQRQWAGAGGPGVEGIGRRMGMVGSSGVGIGEPRLGRPGRIEGMGTDGKTEGFNSMRPSGQATSASVMMSLPSISNAQAVGSAGMGSAGQAQRNGSGLVGVSAGASAGASGAGGQNKSVEDKEMRTGGQRSSQDKGGGRADKSSGMGSETERRGMGMGSLLNSDGS